MHRPCPVAQRRSERPSLAWPELALIAASLAVSACSTPPAPPFVLELPELEIATSFDGSGGLSASESGTASTQEASERAAPAAGVRCRILYALDPPAHGAMASLSGRTLAAADLTGDEPVLSTPELTAGALYLTGPDAAAWAESLLASSHAALVTERSVALPRGSSLRMGITSRDLVEDPRDWLDEFENRGPVPRRVGVDVHAGRAGLALALEVTDLDPQGERAILEAMREDPNLPAEPPAPAYTLDLRQEAIAVAARPAPGAPVAILLDSPFNGGNGNAVVVLVEAIPAEQARTSVEEAAAILALAGVERVLSGAPVTDGDRERLRREEAIRAFRQRGGRSALLLLAEEADAELAAELSLLGTDEVLAELGLLAFGEDPDAVPEASQIGWNLESAAWTMLASGALEETLPKELEGAFFRRAGAVARFPDIVLDLVATSGGSVQALASTLEAENRLALEDASPAGRVAGHDWLVERGLSVPDYDPLADRKARRAALEAAAPAREETQR